MKSLLNVVLSSKLLTNGCKRYYLKLLDYNKASKINNWKITNGKYQDCNFISPSDNTISKDIFMSVSSIKRYRKTLKSLGLIAIPPKFTTRTNKSTNYHHRQIMIVLKSLPKKLISKSLTILKGAKILKISNSIITKFFKNLNGTVRNIHSNLKKIVEFWKQTN